MIFAVGFKNTSAMRLIVDMKFDFSVLMSVYIKETPKNFGQALQSVLIQAQPEMTEVVVIEDGPLNVGLYKTLEDYSDRFKELNIDFVRVKNVKSTGLGKALAKGVVCCRNEYIFRMDTDDLCVVNRFNKQLMVARKNPNFSIIGGQIQEFSTSPEEKLGSRIVPLNRRDIIKFSKKRNPFNHMTVLIKRSSVLKAGNYRDYAGYEDYELWARMLVAGEDCCNLPEILVKVRTGENMFKRRGGIAYFKQGKRAKIALYHDGLYSLTDMLISILATFIVATAPVRLREKIYKVLLRN